MLIASFGCKVKKGDLVSMNKDKDLVCPNTGLDANIKKGTTGIVLREVSDEHWGEYYVAFDDRVIRVCEHYLDVIKKSLNKK